MAGEDQADPGATAGAKRFSVVQLWPLAILVAGLVLFFATGANKYVTFETLRENREALLDFVADNAVLAGFFYTLAYVAVAAFSLPVGLVASITGGFLFGSLLATTYIVVGATIGATLLFLAAKTSIGDTLRAKAGPNIRRMEEGFRENAFSYLLILRLVPLFPFFVVNLAPAFLGVSLPVYVGATLIGIIPGSFVYAQIGTGLGSVFQSGEEFSAENLVTTDIVLALVGLALLSALPIVYKKFKARKAG